MMIALDRRGDYAVRAVLDLARHYPSTRRKAREIALAMDIPPRYLPQLIAPLVKAGLVNAVAGPVGGYSLARPPEAVSLLEVVEAAEGRIESPQCVLRGGPHDWGATCPLHEAWLAATRALANQLSTTNFAELASRDALIQKGKTKSLPGPLHLEPVERRGVR